MLLMRQTRSQLAALVNKQHPYALRDAGAWTKEQMVAAILVYRESATPDLDAEVAALERYGNPAVRRLNGV
jgi:hypothetical protein